MVVYEASGLVETARDPAGPEERSSTVVWLSPEEIRAALRSGEPVDSTTTIALYRIFGGFLDAL
jgi:hypothetical protein